MLADSWRCSNELITHQATSGLIKLLIAGLHTHQHDPLLRGKRHLLETYSDHIGQDKRLKGQ